MLIMLTSCDISVFYIQADKVLLDFFSLCLILTSFAIGITPVGGVCMKSCMGTLSFLAQPD